MYYIESGQEDSSKLFQGDIFEPIPCPFLQQVSPTILREDGDELVPYLEQNLGDAWSRDELILVRARKVKVILLSQTCDIHEEHKPNLHLQQRENYDFPFILYAPLIPMNQLQEYPRLARNQGRVRGQNLAGAFWLPNDSQRGIEESVVFFPLVCSMQKSRNNRFETFSPRRRLVSLKSPFREALASKFSHWISRVALPSDFVFTDNRPSSTRT